MKNWRTVATAIKNAIFVYHAIYQLMHVFAKITRTCQMCSFAHICSNIRLVDIPYNDISEVIEGFESHLLLL